MNISRVGIQDYSFMCMKWSKTQVYIRNPCLKTISSCQNVKLGSSLLILFYSLLCFAFLFANSLLSTCCSYSRYHSLPILHPAYIIPGFSSFPESLHIFYSNILLPHTTILQQYIPIHYYKLNQTRTDESFDRSLVGVSA